MAAAIVPVYGTPKARTRAPQPPSPPPQCRIHSCASSPPGPPACSSSRDEARYLPRWMVWPRREEQNTVRSRFSGFHMARKTGPFMSTHHACSCSWLMH